MYNMNKSEILATIKKKVYYAELPSKMDVSILNDNLYIIIDADGVLQNMQNDASAFEGGVFCIKSFFPDIAHVVIDWENPDFSLEEKILADRQTASAHRICKGTAFERNEHWESCHQV